MTSASFLTSTPAFLASLTALSSSEESTFTSVVVPVCAEGLAAAGVSVFAVAGFVALSVFVAADAVVLSAVEVDPAGAVVVLAAGVVSFTVVAVELLAASVAAAFDCAARLVSEASATGVGVVGFVAFTSSAATPW